MIKLCVGWFCIWIWHAGRSGEGSQTSHCKDSLVYLRYPVCAKKNVSCFVFFSNWYKNKFFQRSRLTLCCLAKLLDEQLFCFFPGVAFPKLGRSSFVYFAPTGPNLKQPQANEASINPFSKSLKESAMEQGNALESIGFKQLVQGPFFSKCYCL